MRLVYLAAAWTLGMVAAANAPLKLPLIWLAVALIAFALAIVWRGSRLWFIVITAGALGGLRMSVTPVTSEIAALNEAGGMTITGIVTAPPDRRDDHTLLRIETETVTRSGETLPTSGLVLVEAPRLTDADYGDRIAATGLLVTPFTGDRFSYADYLARSGVYSLLRDTNVEILETNTRLDIYGILIDLNTRTAAQIGALLPEPQAGLLAGILLGNERGISPDVRDAFAATGAAHVIAISGFNMTVLSGVVIGVLRRLNLPRGVSVVIALIVLGGYTLFVGASAAVTRAALMSAVLIIGRSLRRRTFLPASLALTAVVLSAINPHVLWDVGFQLSFFATLGIALFAEPLTEWFEHGLNWLNTGRFTQPILDALQEPLIVSASALTLTLPLTILYFGQVAPTALFVNLLIVPVQPAVLILGLLGALVGMIAPVLAQIVYGVDMLFLSWTITVVRLFAVIPAAEVYMHPNVIGGLLIAVLSAASVNAARPTWTENLAKRLRSRPMTAAVILSGVGILLLVGALLAARPDGRLHVWFLDVGHSNAVLIATPGGAHILIDGGRNPSRLLTALGDRLPFDKRSIDLMIWTQPDEFDLGALAAVLDRYTVGTVIDHGGSVLSEWYTDLVGRIPPENHMHVTAGYSLELSDGVRIEILHPSSPPELGDSLDDSTLVVRLIYGETAFLFTGDLSVEAQAALAQQDVSALVMQLPQHGTARSFSRPFFEAVQPGIIVVQVEQDNPRGDPDPDVIDALPQDIPLFRTDASGAIHIISDGAMLEIVRERPTE